MMEFYTPSLTEAEKTMSKLIIRDRGWVFHYSYGALLMYHPG